LEAMNPAALADHHRAVALDHRGHLLALIGMHDKDDLVMTHEQNTPFGRMGAIPGYWGASFGLPICGGRGKGTAKYTSFRVSDQRAKVSHRRRSGCESRRVRATTNLFHRQTVIPSRSGQRGLRRHAWVSCG